MPSWLINAKKIVETNNEESPNVDINLINSSQRKAYDDIVGDSDGHPIQNWEV